MTNSTDRKWRIGQVLKNVSRKETIKKRVLGQIMLNWGVSRRTAIEYLDTLIAGKLVSEEDGNIWRK